MKVDNKKKKELLNNIQAKISKGEIENALELISENHLILGIPKELLIQIEARYIRMKSENIKGIHSSSYVTTELNRITNDILQLISLPKRSIVFKVKFFSVAAVIILVIFSLVTALFIREQIVVKIYDLPEKVESKGYNKSFLATMLRHELVKQVDSGHQKMILLYENDSGNFLNKESAFHQELMDDGNRLENLFDQVLNDKKILFNKYVHSLREFFGKDDLLFKVIVFEDVNGFSIKLLFESVEYGRFQESIFVSDKIESIDIKETIETVANKILEYCAPKFSIMIDFSGDKFEYNYEGTLPNWNEKFFSTNDKIILLSDRKDAWSKYIQTVLLMNNPEEQELAIIKENMNNLILIDSGSFEYLRDEIKEFENFAAMSEFSNSKLNDIIGKLADYIPYRTKQLILATNFEKNPKHISVFGLERLSSNWKIVIDEIKGAIGVNGFAQYNKKREGDGMAPTGLFPVGPAFGHKNDVPTNLNFILLTSNTVWITDPNSTSYNKILEYLPEDVKKNKYEVMKRKDLLHKYGLVVRYNMEETKAGHGSAITIHVERRPRHGTIGCIAIPENSIIELLSWLDKEKTPVILMGDLQWIRQELLSN